MEYLVLILQTIIGLMILFFLGLLIIVLRHPEKIIYSGSGSIIESEVIISAERNWFMRIFFGKYDSVTIITKKE